MFTRRQSCVSRRRDVTYRPGPRPIRGFGDWRQVKNDLLLLATPRTVHVIAVCVSEKQRYKLSCCRAFDISPVQ